MGIEIKKFSELTVEEIRERVSQVTDEQKAETQKRIQEILQQQKNSRKPRYTSFDDVIEEEKGRYFALNMPFR